MSGAWNGALLYVVHRGRHKRDRHTLPADWARHACAMHVGVACRREPAINVRASSRPGPAARMVRQRPCMDHTMSYGVMPADPDRTPRQGVMAPGRACGSMRDSLGTLGEPYGNLGSATWGAARALETVRISGGIIDAAGVS